MTYQAAAPNHTHAGPDVATTAAMERDSWLAYPSGTTFKGEGVAVASVSRPVLVQRSPATLAEFIALDGRSDADVLAYAQRWGALDLCGHNLRRGHGWLTVGAGLIDRWAIEARPGCPRRDGEPVAVWRYWIRQAASLSLLVDGIRRSRPLPDARLLALGEDGPWAEPLLGFRPDVPATDRLAPYLALPDRREASRRGVAEALDSWLHVAGAGPGLRWVAGRPEVRVAVDGLLGALALCLLDEAAGSTPVKCAGCGVDHPPARPTGALRHDSYCDKCRRSGQASKTAAKNARKRSAVHPDWRERERLRAQSNRERAKAKKVAAQPSWATPATKPDGQT